MTSRHNAEGRLGTPEERFWRKVDTSGAADACWPWTAALNGRGYGQFRPDRGRPVKAHRFVYELLVGPIPDGLDIDHRCHDPRACAGGHTCPHRRCVNPAHLEATTHKENVLRGGSPAAAHAAMTHCRRGHLLSGSNLSVDSRGRRECLTCRRGRRKGTLHGEVISPDIAPFAAPEPAVSA